MWPGPIAAVRSGSVSAERYVSTLLDRVERLTSLNAFITMGADGALAAAHTFDAMRACGDQLPPLAGLVIVVKDNINLQGLTTSSGTAALKNTSPRIPGGSSGGTVAAIAARIGDSLAQLERFYPEEPDIDTYHVPAPETKSARLWSI